MQVGDLVRLSRGVGNHFDLESYVAILVKKRPRADSYEYDWIVLTDGRYIALGRQIEHCARILSESR